MRKTILLAIGVLSMLAAGPATRPVQSLDEVDRVYSEHAAIAKRTYEDETAKAMHAYDTALANANQERLAELQALLSKAMKSEDADQVVAVKKRIDEIKSDSASNGVTAAPDVAPPAVASPKNFFGVEGTGNEVVYLCDASGSMLSVFGALQKQLTASVTALDADQEFNVVFFSDDNCFPLFKNGPRPANAGNKKLAADFIAKAKSTGGTQPLPAINFVLKERPDLIYVLTDGFDQISNFDDVTNAFKKGNPGGKIHVSCIFLESDPDPKLEECLKKIATDEKSFKKIEKSQM